MNHPDSRVAGKVFATLGYPDRDHAMVKLAAEDQHHFSKDHPEAFRAVQGAWGRQGATTVVLRAAAREVVSKALRCAWRANAPKRLR